MRFTDHRRFEDLLKRGDESTERAKKILYPALQRHPEAKDMCSRAMKNTMSPTSS
ncbi:MAG: hypothetical protein H0U19_14255 [Acidobacteria bacterium]|nr:hypothetical protein [Acidobacteriota bacterium]